MDDIVSWQKGVIGGTIAWILFTLIFAIMFSLLPPGMRDGAFLERVADYWWSIGSILGIGDALALLSLVGNGFSDGFR